MGISDKIESFIIELLKNEQTGWVDLRRNEMADVFNCVPSQINYVISTRFGPESGYIVESRRGGGGYLRIKKMDSAYESMLSEILSQIGEKIDYQSAKTIISYVYNEDIIDEISSNIMLSAISDRSITIGQPDKDIIRANILKNMLITYLDQK